MDSANAPKVRKSHEDWVLSLESVSLGKPDALAQLASVAKRALAAEAIRSSNWAGRKDVDIKINQL